VRRNAIRADRQLAPLVLVSKITQCGLGQAHGGPADYPIFSERSGHGLNRAYSRAASLHAIRKPKNFQNHPNNHSQIVCVT
jgi:hypothetical protein